MTQQGPYSPDRGLVAKVKRRLIQWRAAKPLRKAIDGPILSVTFDDFPRSAGEYGARVVEAAGGRATYYACTGLSGTSNYSGEMFLPEDLLRLARAGHEIGAHSDTHHDLGRFSAAQAVADIRDNLERLRAMGLPHKVRSFAYPYGETAPQLKHDLTGLFATARGVLPGLNQKGSDLMQLRAVGLSPGQASISRAEKLIDDAIDQGAWIILFTHDVRPDPSEFGVTPEVLEALIRRATSGGAVIRPVGQVIP